MHEYSDIKIHRSRDPNIQRSVDLWMQRNWDLRICRYYRSIDPWIHKDKDQRIYRFGYEDLRIHRSVEVEILKYEDPQLCGFMNGERDTTT